MNKSFTLIEILVVIVVIGVLSAFILVGMSSITSSANIAKGKAFLNSMDNSMLLGRVSQWKFDELSTAIHGTTPIIDSWNNNNGTLTTNDGSTEKLRIDCPSSRCIYFDGIDDFIFFGNNNNLSFNDQTDWTASYWIYPTKETWNVLSSNNTAYPYLMTHTNGSVCLRSSGGNYYSSNYGLIVLNKWQHLVVSCTGSSRILKIYINGEYKWSIGGLDNSQMRFNYLGIENGGSRFRGSIDDVRVYNQAIPTSEIQQNYFVGLNDLYKNNRITLDEFNQRLVDLKTNLSKN
ncbi:MAG: LamG domain-containing protein [Candidatus Pacebacteria bacterium]|nr:LamG domain-containing protein [Candidatus Paceibacterota bacterium]